MGLSGRSCAKHHHDNTIKSHYTPGRLMYCALFYLPICPAISRKKNKWYPVEPYPKMLVAAI